MPARVVNTCEPRFENGWHECREGRASLQNELCCAPSTRLHDNAVISCPVWSALTQRRPPKGSWRVRPFGLPQRPRGRAGSPGRVCSRRRGYSRRLGYSRQVRRLGYSHHGLHGHRRGQQPPDGLWLQLGAVGGKVQGGPGGAVLRRLDSSDQQHARAAGQRWLQQLGQRAVTVRDVCCEM